MEQSAQVKSLANKNMRIIATSDCNNKITKKQWIGYALVGLLIAAVCLWMTFEVSELAIFLLLLYGALMLRLIINDYRSRKNIFVAFEEKGLLRINFVKWDNNGNAQPIKLCFQIKSINGFTLHAFFKMKPSFIELEELVSGGFVKKVMIPLEDLSNQEAQKLIYYFESKIPNKTKQILSEAYSHKELNQLQP